MMGMSWAHAAHIAIQEYIFNVNGSVTESSTGDPLPTSLDSSGFDFGTGLGQLIFSIGGAGDHSIISFFDHEIDQSTNTFFNELGMSSGTADSGQSWEIDEPGFLFGDIFDNVINDTLDNFSAVNSTDFPSGDDVSMAMGFNFSLTAGQTATVTFNLSETNDASGFFLAQEDPDSSANIFFWGQLEIMGDGGEPPVGLGEPSTIGLLLVGWFAIYLLRRHRII